MTACTIVIPCFNDGRYLRASVESALAQTHPNTEVILVDDGSTDTHTRRVIEEVKPSVSKLITRENGGPGSARNHGIQEASGPYVLCLDSDDRIEATYVAKASAILDEFPHAGIVYCAADRFDNQGRHWGWRQPEYSLGRMLVGNVVHAGGVFRRSDWAFVGGYRREQLEDYGLWLRILALGREVRHIDEVLYHYRSNPGKRRSSLSEYSEARAMESLFLQSIHLYEANAAEFFLEVRRTARIAARYQRRYGRIDGIANSVSRFGRGKWKG